MRTIALTLALACPLLEGGDVATLVAQLGAEDASKRDAAQRGLEKLGSAPLAELQQALSAAADPEVRSRLQTLIEAIEGEADLFEAIPPEQVADISPLVHTFHAEWASLGPARKGRFDSIRALVQRGAPAIGVLRIIVGKIDVSCADWTGDNSRDWPDPAARALAPEASSAECPGLDDMGPLYAEIIANPGKSIGANEVRAALLKQKSLGATTALLAWVRTTREPIRAGLTGGCTGTAALLYNDLMSVERALVENSDKRLVPALMDLLDADDVSPSFAHIEGNFTVPSPTQVAIETLRKLTAQEFPYDGLEASRDKRAEAIDRVTTWCKDHAAK